MTKREKYYHWRKSKLGRMYVEMKRKVFNSFFEVNAAGSWVGINEMGNVEVKILSPQECFEVMEKYKDAELPQEYTITYADFSPTEIPTN